VANVLSHDVSQYSINPGGTLSPLSPATVAAGAGPWSVTVDPSGQFVHAANSDGNNISQYAIRPDGRLTPLRPATVATGLIPLSITATGSVQ